MAQHDFAPVWLNFPTPPSSAKLSLNFEKHSENFPWTENRYDVSRGRHNSSDGFDSGIGRSNGEHRLLKEMGWQEDSENDETCAPLTEDEMREFQVISEQLQKNGLRKNSILKNGLIYDFKFGPWKNSTFKPTIENDDTETSSSDTSDDDDV
ncbi:Vasculin [Tupaia chinensis]|uniref:Vasculin n=1 Tax=Tupaia chinensis TaxID=246437 RepID=L9KWI9_TUPCH|nr:Vasculin [Tupaia chinensis]